MLHFMQVHAGPLLCAVLFPVIAWSLYDSFKGFLSTWDRLRAEADGYTDVCNNCAVYLYPGQMCDCWQHD